MKGGLYGPNSREIERFFARLSELSLERLGDAIRAWRAEISESGAWHGAEDAVSRAITATGRHRQQWLMLERLFNTFRDAPWFTEGRPGSLIPGSDAAAQYVTTSALLALLVRDVLDSATFDILYLPFQRIIPAEPRARSADQAERGFIALSTRSEQRDELEPPGS